MLNRVSISVCITCCNLEKYLEECLESIAAQTMPPTEVIIVHDGCEKSWSYGGAVNLFRQQNRGVARSRHEAVLLAQSDNILFVDADDILNEQFIQLMINARLEHPEGILYPNVINLHRWGESKNRNEWAESVDTVSYATMYSRCPIVISSLIPKKVYEEVRGFDPTLKLYEDWDFHFKVFELGYEFIKVPQAVLKYRSRSKGRNKADADLRNEMFYEVQGRHLPPEAYEKKST